MNSVGLPIPSYLLGYDHISMKKLQTLVKKEKTLHGQM